MGQVTSTLAPEDPPLLCLVSRGHHDGHQPERRGHARDDRGGVHGQVGLVQHRQQHLHRLRGGKDRLQRESQQNNTKFTDIWLLLCLAIS